MEWSESHPHAPDTQLDGGDLDCGNGLLLLIRRAIDPLQPGQFLEVLSTDSSVEEDLPAWSRLTGNPLMSRVRLDRQRSYLLQKGASASLPTLALDAPRPVAPVSTSTPPSVVTPMRPFGVTGIGSWPRPRWLLQALHDFLSGRLDETLFHQTAEDAIRLAIAAQDRAGVDMVTDGEQRRDNYASFVGSRLENCQLVPLTDLLPYVDDPQKFAEELRGLDIPADSVRHPAVFGKLSRSKPLAVHELTFTRSITNRPVKVALPGPYLLTRTMWLECVSEKVYTVREDLANDIVRILREELADLLAGGASLVQFDEPILTEIVFGKPAGQRTFMCGALGAKLPVDAELEFAGRLIRRVLDGFPRDRLALHVCRGNWSRDESLALRGDYKPLIPLLATIPVGTFFLEMCTPRAGEMSVLRQLPESSRLGLGVVNPKDASIESVVRIVERADEAVRILGPERVLLNPDCGFATFADNPITPGAIAESKLRAMVEAGKLLRRKYQSSE